MSDRPLLLEIIDVVQKQGLGGDECQLWQMINTEALERFVDSTSL